MQANIYFSISRAEAYVLARKLMNHNLLVVSAGVKDQYYISVNNWTDYVRVGKELVELGVITNT